MTAESHEILRHLPALRRHARCLTGAQDSGDALVGATLEALLADAGEIPRGPGLRVALWQRFHRILAAALGTAPVPDATGPMLERRIGALPRHEREALLLVTLCDFQPAEVATILGLAPEEVSPLLSRARQSLNDQTRTRVLVIEDEPVIAFDLAGIVTRMGHLVTGIAGTAEEAVAMAEARRPGIVLADIQLRGAATGIDAVGRILASIDVPVIFVTAFPERLLTGKGPEPTYLITKPFDIEVLEVTIAQALLLHPATPLTAAG